jgi:hypothetical protein
MNSMGGKQRSLGLIVNGLVPYATNSWLQKESLRRSTEALRPRDLDSEHPYYH